jgi:hypothetical protein
MSNSLSICFSQNFSQSSALIEDDYLRPVFFIRLDEYVRKEYSRFGEYVLGGNHGRTDSGVGQVEVWGGGREFTIEQERWRQGCSRGIRLHGRGTYVDSGGSQYGLVLRQSYGYGTHPAR